VTAHTPDSPVTIVDVAELAGVSIATVSRALRGFDNVAPGTADRVLQAAEELGYSSSANATKKRSGMSPSVTLIVSSLEDWYHSEVMAGAEAGLSDTGYDTLVTVASSSDDLHRAIETVRPRRSSVDGLIVIEQQLTEAHIGHLSEWRCPTAIVGQLIPNISCVAIDDYAVGSTAAEHLLELGHTRIGLIQGTGHRVDDASAQTARRAGFVDALQARDLQLLPQNEVTGPYTLDGGMRSIARLMAQTTPPTAVFCMSDLIAVGAMRSLQNVGLSAPKDVSIIGVDDHALSSQLGLTTVRQPVGSLGATAARLVLERCMDPQASETHVHVDTELVIRATTSPPQQ